ncbi:hypothetical protein CI109_103523 [Kwoniella shandongensis]|uniref:Uncharacterized protein n=1 Tax=Kwoniella shandongensis TaxID=1734106 RepID=A0A5M6BXX5_9TREE|nr:uncharacterized protein CI109_004575 [Kwoniella shandongensis]KAA5527040.1 hypothetical protein CI109_004575 [Kwoniella shandongensis]
MSAPLRSTLLCSAGRALRSSTLPSNPIASSSRYIVPTSRAYATTRPTTTSLTIKSQLRERRWNSSASTDGQSPRIEAPSEGENTKPQKIGQIEPRLQMTFTCTADGCGHRSTHEFSKRAYTKGLVLVQCPECKNRHLIADHIGWFKESLEGGKLKTVEDLLAAKGEKIRKGRVNFDGDIELEGDE